MTYARPMFPPVDPTRRRFLSATAGLAAGGTAIALAIPRAPAAATPLPALSLPAGPLDGTEASPALRAAALVLQEASDALDAAKAAFKIQDNLAVEWQNQNPAPRGDRRKLKRWFRRERDRRQASAMRAAWDAQIAAEEAFEAAQIAVAKVKPRDMTDLVLKACLAFVVEEPAKQIGWNAHVIARSVALSLANMASAVAS
ncbi:hypothetical protein V1281_001759 [Nitrobacteraceae bacterium AZCC 2161]